MMTTWFILARAVHIGACLFFFGFFAFDRGVAGVIRSGRKDEAQNHWQACVGIFSLILLPVILLSGIAWFLFVALTMGGEPLRWEVLNAVWSQTQFGTLWKVRLGLWLVAVVIAVLAQPAARFKKLAGVQLLLGGALLGSLVWAGHGQEDSLWHLGADGLHLLVAGLWPAGLLPLALLLRIVRTASGPAAGPLTALIVRRFSAVSLVSVALLTLTGFINAWYLVGSFMNLFQETYGRWLLAKILLFGLVVGIGAVNLLWLKPRLGEGDDAAAAAGRLRSNVRVELFIATIIIVIVAIMGVLPPDGR